jgi:selenocysteine-specific elongation factor
MLIGTAGHIDHGKTALVKALTGVDADRLPEEKARGITVDLGYAYTPLPGGGTLGFIDVPGHEKLIHNMLAGSTGIDFVLLVVAADDGPMPQTGEHLELIDLLGLTCGAVALTKCDLVEPKRLEQARAEVEHLLAGTGLAGSPIFAVSSLTGAGMPALQNHLQSAALQQQARSAAGRFRLAIDRCFSLSGIGTVVTGTVFSGRVAVGEHLQIAPVGLTARVRSLHVQDQPAQQGRAGERCALALSGDFEKKDVQRGMWLIAPTVYAGVQRFQAELRVPVGQSPLKHWTPAHMYLGADDILARIALLDVEVAEPGSNVLAEIILERETNAVRGDRFVLRDAGAQRSLAGGRVIDIFPPTRHKRSPERLAMLAALCQDEPAIALGLAAAQTLTGVDLTRFIANWNLDSSAADSLWQSVHLRVVIDGPTQFGFAPAQWEALHQRLLDTLAKEHQHMPDMLGVERERLRRMTLATLTRAVFDALVAELLADARVRQTRAWLHLPEHVVRVKPADQDLFSVLRPALDAAPLNPPRVRDVALASGVAEDVVRQLFRRVARAGELYPVAHDHFFTASAVSELALIVSKLCGEHGTARAAALRDVIGGGRKVAIQILEFFDRTGYTRRVRDEHLLRQDYKATQWQA